RGKALGIYSSVSGLALIAGPTVGGAIAEGLAWQWIFWINIPIGAVVIPLVLKRIPESFGPRARLDIPGIALVTGAALGGGWGLHRGRRAQPGGDRVARCRPRAGSRLRRLRAGHARADGADAAVPLPRLLGRNRGELPVLCIDVRRAVLPAAVPTGGAGPRT